MVGWRGKQMTHEQGNSIGAKEQWVVRGENVSKNKNISNDGYISTSILRVYRIYQRYIDGYFDTNGRPKSNQ